MEDVLKFHNCDTKTISRDKEAVIEVDLTLVNIGVVKTFSILLTLLIDVNVYFASNLNYVENLYIF